MREDIIVMALSNQFDSYLEKDAIDFSNVMKRVSGAGKSLAGIGKNVAGIANPAGLVSAGGAVASAGIASGNPILKAVGVGMSGSGMVAHALGGVTGFVRGLTQHVPKSTINQMNSVGPKGIVKSLLPGVGEYNLGVQAGRAIRSKRIINLYKNRKM
jgi:hypothetical protein